MKNAWIALSILVLTSACATWQKPPEDKLQTLPVIRFGEAAPSGDFILFFPAGQPIPNRVVISGDVFARTAEDTLDVALQRDLYVHKQWISYDKKTWIHGQRALELTVGIKVPGYDHPRPGLIEVKMNAK